MSDNIGIIVYSETKKKTGGINDVYRWVGYRENLKTYVRCCEISLAFVIAFSDLKVIPRGKIG